MKRILIIVAIQRKADRLQLGLGFASQRKSKGRTCNSYDIINSLLQPSYVQVFTLCKAHTSPSIFLQRLQQRIKGEVKRFLSEVLLWDPLCVEKLGIKIGKVVGSL